MIIAYTALHYGSPYLESAIASVIDHVDRYYVLYSPTGSHGVRASMELPLSEYRISLQRIALAAAGSKLEWVDGNWIHEGNQRDAIYQICPMADTILVIDYDEIWVNVPDVIKKAQESEKKFLRLPMIHYWRSFYYAVLHDPAFPIRVIQPKKEGEGYLDTRPINHMGYAIPTWLLQYKFHIHGHRGEFRTDEWFEKKWLANAMHDCHPVGSDYWNPERINPYDYMPIFMTKHPYWKKEIIE